MTNFTTSEQLSLSNLLQYNGDRYDQTANPYGFAGVGYQTLFPQSLTDTATIANAIDRLATQIDTQVTANAAIVASRPKATSTTSATVASTGSFTFATVENLLTAEPFFVGDFIKAYNDAAPADYVWGQATAVSANSITIAVTSSGGSGTFAAWTIIATGERGAATGIASLSQDTAPMLGANMTTGGYTVTFSATGSQLVFNSASSGAAMNRTPLDQPAIQNYGEVYKNLGTISNTVALTTTNGNHSVGTLGGNISVTLPSSGLPTNQKVIVGLRVLQAAGNSYTMTLPAASSTFKFVGAVPVAPAAGTATEVIFETIDGGTSWIVQTRFSNI